MSRENAAAPPALPFPSKRARAGNLPREEHLMYSGRRAAHRQRRPRRLMAGPHSRLPNVLVDGLVQELTILRFRGSLVQRLIDVLATLATGKSHHMGRTTQFAQHAWRHGAPAGNRGAIASRAAWGKSLRCC